MCGIVGAVAQRDVADILMEGLKRLEYRGYDSAGLAILNQGRLQRVRCVGKVSALAQALEQQPLTGGTGIAHTRWATHGEPNEANAHPQLSGEEIAVVHNGIIENFAPLREQLKAEGYRFTSDTDTEVIAHLVAQALKNTDSLVTAVQKARKQLIGAYGMAVMNRHDASQLVATRSGSPLVVGVGIGEHFIASDPMALLPVTRDFIYLEEGDLVQITRQSVKLWNTQDEAVERPIQHSDLQHDVGSKGHYRHFMLKEIFEQPHAIAQTLEGRLVSGDVIPESFGVNAPEQLKHIDAIQIVACGTSYHAAMVARYWLEDLAGIPCQVEIASEFRYRKQVVPNKALFITLSQSGETADTLAALRLAKQLGYATSLTFCNAPGSSLVRESDLAYLMRAGTEIGVASTKAFTVQLVGLMLLTLVLARYKGMNPERVQQTTAALAQLPQQMEQGLQLNDAIVELAMHFADKHHALFLGRGTQYPIAMEGALKLKEISYIHAEAYAAGELKHGPLALIDEDMPVVVVAPNNALLEKLRSNMEEVKARGGKLYIFADKDCAFTPEDGAQLIQLDTIINDLAPILYTLPLQLLSYHVAIIKGTDVDQPRNLAKSVTVE